ncbi:MAG: aspartate aminotransferase [Deltaproteobacteria bacterium HGW-Deltaproteobacteria-18]|jgi:aspartate/methionine/tyrosine aminotransferase|nr:MAG: aspartate aminotransferase [Deltaproteobacteria bacterium HGW-Deltaproteobacteria-18]
MFIADRIARLGTETAFAVAGRAAAHKAAGHEVFPFHLGDLNIPTPQNVMDAACRAMRNGKTGYCPSPGIPELRDALAQDVSAARGLDYAMENVAIQPGGKPVIGKFIMACVNPGDEVLYPNPGYPIYESQIEYHGGVAVPYRYIRDGSGFHIDLDHLESLVTPHTRAIIINDLQNPLGAQCSDAERERLAHLVMRHNLSVLLDEAYFDIRYGGKSSSLASIPGMQARSVILYTFSKKFAMTGWRLGAAIGPRAVIDIISKLNVNDESCSNHFVQHGALEGLTGDQSGPLAILKTLKERRDTAVELLNSMPGVDCPSPEATFYLFPEVTELMARKGFGDDYARFAEDILVKTGVSLCTRLHFGRPLPGETRRFVRLAYSGIDTEGIRKGLAALKAYAAE